MKGESHQRRGGWWGKDRSTAQPLERVSTNLRWGNWKEWISSMSSVSRTKTRSRKKRGTHRSPRGLEAKGTASSPPWVKTPVPGDLRRRQRRESRSGPLSTRHPNCQHEGAARGIFFWAHWLIGELSNSSVVLWREPMRCHGWSDKWPRLDTRQDRPPYQFGYVRYFSRISLVIPRIASRNNAGHKETTKCGCFPVEQVGRKRRLCGGEGGLLPSFGTPFPPQSLLKASNQVA